MKTRSCLSVTGLLIIGACVVVLLLAQTTDIPGLSSILPGPKSVITGSGILVKETREVTNIDGSVILKAPGELIITTGEANALVIEAEDNLLGIIQTRIESGVLVIELSTEPNVSLQLNQQVRYLLSMEELKTIEVSGTGTIGAAGIKAEDLKVNLSGGGEIGLSGQVRLTEVKINGAGIYKAADLQSRDTIIDIKGGGDATVWATERLDVKCRGACSVKYYGNPELGKNIDAVGLITSLGEK